jgi:hypothetical protein
LRTNNKEAGMLNKIKSVYVSWGKILGKLIHFSRIILLLYLIPYPALGQDYWVNAPTAGIKIFTIAFTDSQFGEAISVEGELLITTDSGKSWNINSNFSDAYNQDSNSFLWKSEIHCSIMHTTDSGLSWLPYENEKQEHFCRVYLKDGNTNYRIAEEFLNMVTSKIFQCINNNEVKVLMDNPQQCAEYYTNSNEGWALGWCIKDFQSSTYNEIE